MKMILIVAHFCSENLGDRYQGRTFADILGNRENVKYANINNISEQYDVNLYNEMYTIISPDKIDVNWCNLAIFPIGSYNGNANYIKVVKEIAERNTECKIIIWGGFTCVNDINDETTYFRNFEIFNYKNVYFYGRGKADVDLYDKITENRNRKIAGDPLIYYSEIFNKKTNQMKCKRCEFAYIMSIHFYKNYPTFFNYLVENSSIVISVDPYADDEIIKTIQEDYPNREIVKTNEPMKLLEIIQNYDTIITNRLHGGILSLATDMCTMMISSDNARDFVNSFKYHSVGLTGAGKLCEVYDDIYENYKNIRNKKITKYHENVEKYIEITKKTLNEIITEI